MHVWQFLSIREQNKCEFWSVCTTIWVFFYYLYRTVNSYCSLSIHMLGCFEKAAVALFHSYCSLNICNDCMLKCQQLNRLSSMHARQQRGISSNWQLGKERFQIMLPQVVETVQQILFSLSQVCARSCSLKHMDPFENTLICAMKSLQDQALTAFYCMVSSVAQEKVHGPAGTVCFRRVSKSPRSGFS